MGWRAWGGEHDHEQRSRNYRNRRDRADRGRSRDGRIHAAIIDFGGFLGIGTRKIAVDWNALVFASEGKPGVITLELNRNQVRLAPQYKRGEPLVVVGTASGGARAARSREAATPER